MCDSVWLVANRLTEIAPGVLVATAVSYVTTTTVVVGDDGGCLVIDPAVTVDEVTELASSMAALGLHPVTGWSTHPHWDHLLWHAALGDVVRYATPRAVAGLAEFRSAQVEQLEHSAPGYDLELFAKVTPLEDDVIRWDGPAAQVIAHDAHAPGHGAVFLPETGVLVAGDMCSEIEIPLLELESPDPLGDYRTGLSRLAAVSGLRHVVPGHGSAGDAEEFQRRIDADTDYLDRLSRGEHFDDPRLTALDDGNWLRIQHQAQLKRYGGEDNA
jgi:hydroxyacylglutathione hydrolase